MARDGAKLEGVDPEQLHQQLRRETDAKATKQLTVTLLYDAGFSAYEIEDLLGVPAQTGYNWLEAVAEREVTALGDAPKSGRPPRLSTDQWTELSATLHASPAEVGYDDPVWSPEILSSHILDTYVIEYSHAHMYLLLEKARLSRQTAQLHNFICSSSDNSA